MHKQLDHAGTHTCNYRLLVMAVLGLASGTTAAAGRIEDWRHNGFGDQTRGVRGGSTATVPGHAHAPSLATAGRRLTGHSSHFWHASVMLQVCVFPASQHPIRSGLRLSPAQTQPNQSPAVITAAVASHLWLRGMVPGSR